MYFCEQLKASLFTFVDHYYELDIIRRWFLLTLCHFPTVGVGYNMDAFMDYYKKLDDIQAQCPLGQTAVFHVRNLSRNQMEALFSNLEGITSENM